MRKKLTVVQIICILISGLLTLWDKMFIWRLFEMPGYTKRHIQYL